MVARHDETAWVFRAEFLLGVEQDLRVRRAVLLSAAVMDLQVLQWTVFRLPISLWLSIGMTAGIVAYALREPDLGRAILEAGDGIIWLVLLTQLLTWGAVYGIGLWARLGPKRQVSDRQRSDRPVVFKADAAGYRWQAPGTLIEGRWSSVDAIWSGKDGLAVLRGADVAVVPRNVFLTETDFVALIDRLTSFVSAKEAGRVAK